MEAKKTSQDQADLASSNLNVDDQVPEKDSVTKIDPS